MTTSLTEIDAILKDRYDGEVPMVGVKDPVAFATITKTTNFKGRRKSFALQTGITPGTSHDFTHAQANADEEAFDEFLVTRGRSYTIIKVDLETFEAADGEGAQIAYVERQVETARKTERWRLNRAFYRNHGAAMFRLNAAASGGGTDTLLVREADWQELHFLSRNHVLVSSNTDGTSGSVDANPGVVAAVNRKTGQIVIASGTWNASFANSDYVFLEGDFGAGYYGFGDWIPPSDPSATTFFGLDRTTDMTRYSGNRSTATAEDNTLENFLLRAVTETDLEGNPSTLRLYWHPNHFTQLVRELGSKVEYSKVPTVNSTGANAEIGFRSVMLVCGGIDLEIIKDRDAPLHRGFLVDPGACSFEGLGEAARVLKYKDDSMLWSRLGDADAMESRMGTKGQFVFHQPANFNNMDLSALTNP
jgi:hypothetical protein